jgi:hypothetical protein
MATLNPVTRTHRNRKENTMIVEIKGSDYYHVPLVDLRQHYDERVLRTFASSEQVIDWVKHHPNVVFKAVRHGALGEKVSPSSQVQLGEDYGLETGDIIVGNLIVCDGYGLRKPGLSTGGG